MSKQSIGNNAPAHKYFTTMLNMADDDLDPFQYRLLAHYIRKSGHGGKIDESVRETAKLTKMSTVKVQRARNELAAAGYIELTIPSKAKARKGETVKVTILDRWAENVNRYTKPVSDLTQVEGVGVLNITQQPVLEITQPTREPVLNLTRNKKNEKQKKKEQVNQFRLDWDAYADYGCALLKQFGIDCAFQKPSEMPEAALTAYLDTAKQLKPAGATIDEIPMLYRYVYNRSKRENWSGFGVKTLAKYFLDYRAALAKRNGAQSEAIEKVEFEPILLNYVNKETA